MADGLLWAAKNGDLEAVKAFVEKPGYEINAELTGGRHLLHLAADYGHTELVQYLISKGAKVDLPDKHGITPLLAAIFEDHLETAKVLIDKGANKNGKAPDGQSYLDCAESDEMKALLK